MFTVTEAALDRLSKKLARMSPANGMPLRLTLRARGWRLRPDGAHPGDTTFTHEGRKVLLLDAAVTQVMTNMTLDVRSTDSGPRLRLRDVPDATRSPEGAPSA
jgi:hypothetical protein